MKKSSLYIILFLVVLALVALVLTSENGKRKKIDDRITLVKEDKIPYGAYVAYRNLPHIFPNAAISSSKQKTGYWDSLSNYDSGQALLIISPKFYADEFEMKTLIRFCKPGNDVFISTRNISPEVENLLRNWSNVAYYDEGSRYNQGSTTEQPNLVLKLNQPYFNDKKSYGYKGELYNGWFYKIDENTTDALGTDDLNRTNFVHLKAGKGNLFIHLAPLAFSNYFLLQGENMEYYENALSVISKDTRRIVWDEYYLEKNYDYRNPYQFSSGRKEENFLTELFKYTELKWALLTGVAAILLFIFLEMRRKQRSIPRIAKSRNESLDFVKTIGRLYFDKGDHHNLCRKMGAHFLEFVRSNYKIPTGNLDDAFVDKLRDRSGVDETDIRGIVSFIKYLDDTNKVSGNQLAEFHKHLESFYQKV